MTMRRNYEMSESDLAELLSAMKPVPAIALHCGPLPSAQESANAAWKRLGEKMGFDYMTVRPSEYGNRFFSAEQTICQGMEIESGVFSGCNATGGDCPECGK